MHLDRGRRAPALGAPNPDFMEEFPAGAVKFGVEYRDISGYKIPDFWEAEKGAQFADAGVTLHVFDADSGVEHIRIDCFSDDPHYHYSCQDTEEYLVVRYDAPANGDDMLGWALNCFRGRLGPMLASSRGGKELADKVDDTLVADALDRVEDAARRIQKSPPPIPRSPEVPGLSSVS